MPSTCAKRRGSLLFVAGITADRGQSVRSERHETRFPKPPGDIFDIWIEPAVLMNHKHRSEFLAFRRLCKIALDRAVALRRLNCFVTELKFLVVLRHRLCPRIIGLKALKDRRDRQTADGEFRQAVEKGPAVDIAVLLFVKKVQ